MTRVPLVPPDADIPVLQQIDAGSRERGYAVLDIYRVLAHRPSLLEAFSGLGYAMPIGEDGGDLSIGRVTMELVVMRIAEQTGSAYELAHHEPVSLAVGVSQEQLDALPTWQLSGLFSDRERAALAMTDALIAGPDVPTQVFDRCAELFDTVELVELVLLASWYCCIVRFCGALDLDVEADHEEYVRAWAAVASDRS
ncbi:carboxymuconolactone decarboxylase family protein [Candidatus Poriferisocius sp.]|uniref:carboxymuconolactone decarboxylase family protein n=1 Tax=Candidatus Poriferisocius sp. TaxID=3101276 RepID=UPI003B025571